MHVGVCVCVLSNIYRITFSHLLVWIIVCAAAAAAAASETTQINRVNNEKPKSLLFL